MFQLIHQVNKIPIAVLLGGGYHVSSYSWIVSLIEIDSLLSSHQQYDVETAAASICQMCRCGMSPL